MPDFFAPTFIILVLFLLWTSLCFMAGYTARGDEDITKFIEKTLGKRPPDDPPPKTRV